MIPRAIGLLILPILIALAACEPTPRQDASPVPDTPAANARPGASPPAIGPRPGPALSSIAREPTIRVRVAANQAQADIHGPGDLHVSPAPNVAPRIFTPPLRITRQQTNWILRDARGQTLAWAVPTLRVSHASDAPLSVGRTAYPGQLVVVPAADERRLHVVNHLPLEQYLPGVVYRELYPNWSPAAFRAQAIAARSYALWEMTLQPHRAWDLESTTASQAYAGSTDHANANAAVAATRGMVLAYGGRVVPAFYNSTSGPIAQDAIVAFPNRAPNIPPLVGGPRGEWDRTSPHYRWQVTRTKQDLAARLAAWGRANRHPIAGLSGVNRINISRRTRSGPRPAAFLITDVNRGFHELPAESFRQAANHPAPGLGPVSRQQRLKSSFVTIQVNPTSITFAGHGFGHGVGMSQFGAQALAVQGHDHPAILRFYYPGSEIKRVY